jgi:DNA-3-methyladenine glycosylase
LFAKELAKASLLKRDFFARHTVEVAQDLLGKILLVKNEYPSLVRIVETEAYRSHDPASHSARGITPRNAIMFGDPGFVYVYLIYGMYEMLNFVTEPKGQPGAVLIRAVEPIAGVEGMRQRRQFSLRLRAKPSKIRRALPLEELTNGPGRLSQAMGVSRRDQGQSLDGPRFYVFEDGFSGHSIECSPRIGIRVGTEKLWRFYLKQNRFVSRIP